MAKKKKHPVDKVLKIVKRWHTDVYNQHDSELASDADDILQHLGIELHEAGILGFFLFRALPTEELKYYRRAMRKR